MTVVETNYEANVLANNHCCPQQAPDTVEQQQDDLILLTKPDSNEAFRLNASAREIWSLCNGDRQVTEMFSHLRAKYDVPDGELSTALLMTLDQLQRSGHLLAPDLLQTEKQTQVLDLSAITYYVINLKEDHDRREHIRSQLDSLGYKYQFVEGVREGTKLNGIALSHMKILQMPELKVPFAILEDDSCFVRDFPAQITLPANTDAYYLGLSKFGIQVPGQLSRSAWDNIRYIKYADNLYRVFNMLALHAVVYVSETYRQAALDIVKRGLAIRGIEFAGDSYYAKLQTSHLVLAPRQPIAYQAEELGGVEFATRKPLCEEPAG
ncbi:MAG: PqqD family peptide modification chaperone [Pseudomonadota bacterium]